MKKEVPPAVIDPHIVKMYNTFNEQLAAMLKDFGIVVVPPEDEPHA